MASVDEIHSDRRVVDHTQISAQRKTKVAFLPACNRSDTTRYLINTNISRCTHLSPVRGYYNCHYWHLLALGPGQRLLTLLLLTSFGSAPRSEAADIVTIDIFWLWAPVRGCRHCHSWHLLALRPGQRLLTLSPLTSFGSGPRSEAADIVTTDIFWLWAPVRGYWHCHHWHLLARAITSGLKQTVCQVPS